MQIQCGWCDGTIHAELSHCLWHRINEIMSRASLKSTEVKICSRIFRVCASSCCQTSFSKFIRPMLYLWELIAHLLWEMHSKKSLGNHNVVLRWKISKIASWMTLKSSEIQDCSWRISTPLKSFLVSSLSCHALQIFLPFVLLPCFWSTCR